MADRPNHHTDEEERVSKLDHDEEVAAEFSPTPAGIPIRTNNKERNEGEDADTENSGVGLGITALILAVLSFFMLPFLLAPAGIIIGAIAARRGSSWGIWAVAVGIIAVIVSLIVLPFRLIF
ncbi:hypothetical protein [Laceyella tengchongensis]|uniref:hypothetical protein n=1 Tax=Laceyella tengchongensis TaxID=574699 RepID=UPI0012B6B5D7|nr:hypothetical protein [Laceyella tengchongensis]